MTFEQHMSQDQPLPNVAARASSPGIEQAGLHLTSESNAAQLRWVSQGNDESSLWKAS